MMDETTFINVAGFQLDAATGTWTAPKYWQHQKYGIGEMIDAVKTGELWVVVLDFGGEIKKIRQDRLTPYGGVTVSKLGTTIHRKKTEEETVADPVLREPILPVRRGSHRHLTQEDLLKLLRS